MLGPPLLKTHHLQKDTTSQTPLSTTSVKLARTWKGWSRSIHQLPWTPTFTKSKVPNWCRWTSWNIKGTTNITLCSG